MRPVICIAFASKLIMKYLAYMGGYTDAGEQAGSGRSVEEQVGLGERWHLFIANEAGTGDARLRHSKGAMMRAACRPVGALQDLCDT